MHWGSSWKPFKARSRGTPGSCVTLTWSPTLPVDLPRPIVLPWPPPLQYVILLGAIPHWAASDDRPTEIRHLSANALETVFADQSG